MTDLIWLSATQAVRMMARKEISPLEYLDALLARAELVQDTLNPFTIVVAERAREEARLAGDLIARGEKLGALHGLPIHIKDLFPTKNILTEYGSATRKGNVPKSDDVLVARLRAAGAVVFAKTTTPEFGHKGQTDGPHFGTTLNPWDHTRAAGGSSGGAAVAVAAGSGPLGLGTDGAGSIRIPAAACGVVGLKPSPGLLPYGEAVDGFFSYAAAGPLCRTIEDAGLMLRAICGADPADPWSIAAPTPTGCRVGATLHGLRVGYIPLANNRLVAKDVEANTRAVLALIAARGAMIEEVTEEIDWIEFEGRVMYQANIAVANAALVEKHRNDMDPVLVGFVERGAGFSTDEYRRAQLARTRLFRHIQQLFDRYDVLITPTLTRSALPADFDALNGVVEVDGQPAGTTRQGMSPYCYPFNLTGHPALAVPSGFAGDGLPTSVQLVGRWYADIDLLGLGAIIEQERPWADRRPSLDPSNN
jgi:Asp-tRNA(Asn)/Glu-tRNA(Gln) amidotransferase A subunit family amidase